MPTTPQVLEPAENPGTVVSSKPVTSSGESVGMRATYRGLRIADGLVNLVVLFLVLVVLVFSGYSLWDTGRLYAQASADKYEQYKPMREPDGEKSFAELQALNPDVFGWLTLHGTPIDYPLVQGPDDMHYVNTNPLGEYSVSGSIFLSAANKQDFTDFNSIVYGHHMNKDVMFGPLDKYSNHTFFDTHATGSLYYDGTEHGIELFAFTHTTAYNTQIFTPPITDTGRQQEFLDNLLTSATHTRALTPAVSTTDRLVLLTTCSGASTNGRDILIGRITKNPIPNPFTTTPQRGTGADTQNPWWTRVPTPLWTTGTLLLVGLLLLLIHHKHRQHEDEDEHESGGHLAHADTRTNEPGSERAGQREDRGRDELVKAAPSHETTSGTSFVVARTPRSENPVKEDKGKP